MSLMPTMQRDDGIAPAPGDEYVVKSECMEHYADLIESVLHKENRKMALREYRNWFMLLANDVRLNYPEKSDHAVHLLRYAAMHEKLDKTLGPYEGHCRV